MSTFHRVLKSLAGLCLGLALVEGGLQGVKLAVSWKDHQQTRHALGSGGGDLRVLCLGACYTIGIGTAPAHAYPAKLEGLLDAELSTDGRDAVVINGGQRGKSIDHFAREIDALVQDHQPDVLVVGVNRRTSLDASASGPQSPLEWFILPRLVLLASAPPPAVSRVTADSLTLEIQQLEKDVAEDPRRVKSWSQLSTLYAHRGDYAAATAALDPILQKERSAHPQLSLRLFRYAIALGEMTRADEHMAAVRASPGFVREMSQTLRGRGEKYAQDERNVALRTTLDQARLAAVRGELDAARTLLEACLQMDPDTADAWHLLGWVDHVEGRPPQARTTAFLGARASGEDWDGDAFRTALSAHLDRILTATAPEGIAVVLHTLAASPEQIPIILEVAAARGVPVVDVQTALTQVSDPEPLFHPTDHLRFSEAGNAWLADQIHAGLVAAGRASAP